LGNSLYAAPTICPVFTRRHHPFPEAQNGELLLL
jgi:hypothetical protein